MARVGFPSPARRPTAYHFEAAPDPRVEALFGQLAGAADWNSFPEANGTQVFIVIQDGKMVYVSQQKKLVIVRNGTPYGIRSEQWLKLFYEFASQY